MYREIKLTLKAYLGRRKGEVRIIIKEEILALWEYRRINNSRIRILGLLKVNKDRL